MEEVRRNEARQDAQAREQLEKTCWLWRKNPGAVDGAGGQALGAVERQTAGDGSGVCDAAGVAAGVCRSDRGGRHAAASRLVRTGCERRRETLAVGLLEPMRKAAEMVERHLEGILGHWKQGLTTAFLEGLNSLFSATKRKARGYRSSEYQIAMLYFVAGKLEIPYYG